MRGALSERIRQHIFTLEDEWIVDDVCEAFPGVRSVVVSVVVNNMLVRDMIRRTGSSRSRNNRVVATYITIMDAKDKVAISPSMASAKWARLMGDRRYEDVRFKRATP